MSNAGAGGGLHLNEGIRQAFHTIADYRLRSMLLILGVAIGVATLLAIITIVNGLSSRIREDIVSANRPYIYVARYTGLGGEDMEEMMRRRQLLPDLIAQVGAAEGTIDVECLAELCRSGTESRVVRGACTGA